MIVPDKTRLTGSLRQFLDLTGFGIFWTSTLGTIVKGRIMAGSWLYSISKGPGRTFELDGESKDVTIENYWSLIEARRLNEDKAWLFSQFGGQMAPGDELFIYTGTGDVGIIGYASVVSVKKLPRGWSLEPKFDFVKSRMLLDHPISATIVRKWGLILRSNVVDLKMHRAELEPLLPWAALVSIPRLPEELSSHGELTEGAKLSIVVNAYERSQKARQDCIDYYGAICVICGIDFGKTYGAELAGFIHVHHTKPLSEIGLTYRVDPLNDLQPVCPNCHAVVHAGGKCRTVDDVKAMLELQKNA